MQETLQKNLRDTVFDAIGYTPEQKALIVFDRLSPFTTMVTEAYRSALPGAKEICFEEVTPGDIRGAIDQLAPRDLVILIQSGSFRLNEFRFRLELFNRQLAVIEHPHLGRIPESEWQTYVDAMAYDKDYYRTAGPKLKAMIDGATQIIVKSGDATLTYDAPFESAKLNIGDYTGMKNIGGQFPIGEVFTEPSDLANVNGEVDLFAFGNEQFQVVIPEKPVRVVIKNGLIVDAPNAPPEFQAILDQIKAEEPLWVRELGFGLNRAMSKSRILTDIGSYERMCGVHLSLGQKHTIYSKPGFPKRTSHYHVDVFVDVTSVTIDGQTIYQNGTYLI